MTKDEADKAAAGELPDDPFEGATPMGDGWVPIDAVLEDTITLHERRRSGEESPVPFPWRCLTNHFSGGLWNGAYILIGATGSGKTQFAVQMAYNAASQGIPVLYVSLEVETAELVWRFAGARSGQPWSDLLTGHGKNAEEAARSLQGLPIGILERDPYDWDPTKLAGLVETHRNRLPWTKTPRLVIVDYLQFVGGAATDYEEGNRQRMQTAIASLREVSKNQNAVVLALSSTARTHYPMFAGDKSKGPPPPEGHVDRFVGCGKESGEIEYTANAVLAITRSPDDGEEPETARHIAIAKRRIGSTGWVKLHFNGWSFEDRSGEVFRVE